MRRIFILAALTATCAVVVFAQTDVSTLSLADLDLTSATIHQAGPSSFYVRSVGVDGDQYSFLLERSDGDAWSVTRILPESVNILPPEAILDFATISVDGSDIRIDGVLVGDRVYGGSLAIGENADLALAEQIQAVSDTTINDARVAGLKRIVVAQSEGEFEQQLAAQRAELETTISRVEKQRDSYREERDSLADENEQLTAERDALQSERDRLQAELANGGSGTTATAPAGDETTSPLSGNQVAALLKERDDLAGQIVGLGIENNELRAERKTLGDQITDLQKQNSDLRDDVSSMSSEVDRLQELVTAYRSATAADAAGNGGTATTDSTGPTVAPAAATTVMPPDDYLRQADLQAAAQAVSGDIRSLEQRVAALEDAAAGLAKLEETLRTGIRDGLPGSTLSAPQAGELPGAGSRSPSVSDTTGAVSSATAPATEADAQAALVRAEQAAKLAEVQAQLADLLAENESLRSEQQRIEERILNEILSNGFVRMMRDRMSETLVSGFAASAPDTGSWNVRSGSATQSDPDAFFAKLAMPAEQSTNPVLYSFSVRSLDDGWVGVGLHLFVDDVQKRRGYGMGSSLLVWLTRDPDARKSNTTYLQLYRSDDDVNMARVLDAAIPESLGDRHTVDVLYEPGSQYITVAVDGVDRVRYRTWFGIESGVEVALRTLGRAEFSGFSVSTGEVP